MEPAYFPVPMGALAAELRFGHVGDTPWRRGEVEVAATRVRHAACTLGFRIRAGGATVAYVPDNELGAAGDDGWYAGLVEWLRGADVLFHDAMYTDAEYAQRAGWGHSTMRQAVQLAEDAGVRSLFLFHHAPDRGDAELESLVAALRDEVARRGSPLAVAAAAEGEEIAVHATPGSPS
jgi:ribonuclease BN (tRNA processing enzyme)